MRRILCLSSVAALVLIGCSDDTARKDTGPGRKEAGGDSVLAMEGGTKKEAGAACSIVGSWKGAVPAGPYAGQTNVWQLKGDGTSLGTIGTNSVQGTWALAGTTLTVTDTSSVPASVACPAAQQGTYSTSFSTDCNTLTLHALNEPCDGRKVALDGFVPTRQ